ncbi:MAG: hypothetical protein GY778_31345, partial [bacterium]|nr:hypothetical protein [bacterium]
MNHRSLRNLVITLALITMPALVAADNYNVGIYYFGVWNQNSCNVCYGGNTDWWRGAREYAAGDISPKLPWSGEDFTHLEPAIGFYDNSQTGTLAKHIKQARANGVDFFNFYWYWSSVLNGGQGGEKYFDGLHTFPATPTTYALDFAVSITAHPFGNLDIPPSHAPRAISTLIDNYLTQPHYLKTSNGRPVVFLIDTRAIAGGSHSEVVDFLALLDKMVMQEMKVSPFIVFSTELNGQEPAGGGTPVNVDGLGAVDGHSCLNYFGIALDPGSDTIGKMSRYVNALPGVLNNWDNKPVIPCYMSDFNEKPRELVGTPIQNIRYLTDWNLQRFRDGLVSIKTFVDNRDEGLVENHLNLYAWNEWREEGHVLEPNEPQGNMMLNEVASVFGLDTFGTQNCRDTGNCPGSEELPSGTLDAADCTTIAGWARDPDTSLPTTVEIYKGPIGGGNQPVASEVADAFRSDLPFPDKNHGFSIATPDDFETGNPETVYAYARNLGVNGNLLGDSVELPEPITITCGTTPPPPPPTGVSASDGTYTDRV